MVGHPDHSMETYMNQDQKQQDQGQKQDQKQQDQSQDKQQDGGQQGGQQQPAGTTVNVNPAPDQKQQ